jgi:hypothetical protein
MAVILSVENDDPNRFQWIWKGAPDAFVVVHSGNHSTLSHVDSCRADRAFDGGCMCRNGCVVAHWKWWPTVGFHFKWWPTVGFHFSSAET